MRRFSEWSVLAVALLALPISPSCAQSPTSPVDLLQVHFAPRGERQPVHFELVHNHLLLKARLSGHDVWAMLDNGAERTLVDASFAKSIGLVVARAVAGAHTATGSLGRRVVSDATIDLPGQVSLRSPLSAVDLSSISTDLGRPVSLIIGRDYFDVLAFQIIPANETVEVGPTGAFVVPPGTPYLVLKNDTPQIDLYIDGKPATVAVDLGDDGAIGLSDSAFGRLGLNNLPAVEGKMLGAEGVAVRTKSVVARSVTVGPVHASGVSVTEQPILPSDGDGRIGMGFLSRFNFVFDVKARRIWLLSPADEASRVNQLRAAVEGAVLLYKSGHKTDAEAQLTELASQAEWPAELNDLCWAKATARIMLDSAVQECRAAVDLSNRSAEFVDSLGMALLQAGKLDEALAAYAEAIDKAHNAGSYMGRAIVYSRKGDELHAQADLAEARKLDPGIEGRFAGYGLRIGSASR